MQPGLTLVRMNEKTLATQQPVRNLVNATGMQSACNNT